MTARPGCGLPAATATATGQRDTPEALPCHRHQHSRALPLDVGCMLPSGHEGSKGTGTRISATPSDKCICREWILNKRICFGRLCFYCIQHTPVYFERNKHGCDIVDCTTKCIRGSSIGELGCHSCELGFHNRRARTDEPDTSKAMARAPWCASEPGPPSSNRQDPSLGGSWCPTWSPDTGAGCT